MHNPTGVSEMKHVADLLDHLFSAICPNLNVDFCCVRVTFCSAHLDTTRFSELLFSGRSQHPNAECAQRACLVVITSAPSRTTSIFLNGVPSSPRALHSNPALTSMNRAIWATLSLTGRPCLRSAG